MERPLLSIIVPVYKVERFLVKCVMSICNQTYRNLEIVLVDDGSPDDCPQLCDWLADKDNRIRVVHKTNGGISSARNAGLDVARGEYVGFVDSDDWLAPDMYTTLVELILRHDADIAMCAFYYVEGLKMSRSCKKGQKDLLLNRDAALRQLFRDRLVKNYLWDKIYKRSLFDGIRFPLGRTYEDIATLYRVFARIQKFAFSNVPGYYYRIHASSITGESMNPVREYDCFHFFLKQREFAVRSGLWPKAHVRTVKHAVHLLNHLLLLPPSADRDKAMDRILDELHVCDEVGFLTVGVVNALRRYFMFHYWESYKKAYCAYRKVFKPKRKKRLEPTGGGKISADQHIAECAILFYNRFAGRANIFRQNGFSLLCLNVA